MTKIVFTNGCFDLLHAGHISLLEYCASLGSVIVGLNSDASVRRLKGPSRPIISQDQRLYALRSCKWVNEVHVFEEDTPVTLIEKIRPDIIVKGAEYSAADVIGGHLAQVKLFTPIYHCSTSSIVRKIQSGKESL